MLLLSIKNKTDLFAYIISRDGNNEPSENLLNKIYEWSVSKGFHPSTHEFTNVMWVEFMMEYYVKDN